MSNSEQAGPRWTFGVWVYGADSGFGDWLRDIHGHIVRFLDQGDALTRLERSGFVPRYDAGFPKAAYVGHVPPEAK